MAKIIFHGWAKPDDPIYRTGLVVSGRASEPRSPGVARNPQGSGAPNGEPEAGSRTTGAEVTREQAIDIATTYHRGGTSTAQAPNLPEGWLRAHRATEVPPPHMYGQPREPSWYVWFSPRHGGLGSSDVVVVSKRTGQVIGHGSAGDEG